MFNWLCFHNWGKPVTLGTSSIYPEYPSVGNLPYKIFETFQQTCNKCGVARTYRVKH